jgi:alanine racemase
MTLLPRPTVHIDLGRVRHSLLQVRAMTGVAVLAVVKADAYGLGAAQVLDAIHELADGFYTFDEAEAMLCSQACGGRKPTVALHCHSDAATLKAANIRPAVWTVQAAERWRNASPVLSIDTGQQRFAAAQSDLKQIVAAGQVSEAMSHCSTPAQAEQFANQAAALPGVTRLHAAGSALLDHPAARFHAVRPGFALYRGAVRVTSPLIEVRQTNGPAGYGGFTARRHGVIVGGYSNGIRPGPCIVAGTRTRLPEVGMQTAFVELPDHAVVGDTVTLLGDSITEADLATTWRTSQQEALLQLCRAGPRAYHL